MRFEDVEAWKVAKLLHGFIRYLKTTSKPSTSKPSTSKPSTNKLALMLVLFSLAVLVLLLPVSAEAATVRITNLDAEPGSTATAVIEISRVNKLCGAEVNVTFDPSVVHVTGVTEGDMSLMAHNINNDAGWMGLNAISVHGCSDTVVFAKLNLLAVGSRGDASPLSIHVGELFDTTYNDLSYSTADGKFTITSLVADKENEAVEPTPTPSPTETGIENETVNQTSSASEKGKTISPTSKETPSAQEKGKTMSTSKEAQAPASSITNVKEHFESGWLSWGWGGIIALIVIILVSVGYVIIRGKKGK